MSVYILDVAIFYSFKFVPWLLDNPPQVERFREGIDI